MSIRILEPCEDPSGANCTLFEDPGTLHLAVTRWYAASLRIFDGSLVNLALLLLLLLLLNPPQDDYWRCSRACWIL